MIINDGLNFQNRCVSSRGDWGLIKASGRGSVSGSWCKSWSLHFQGLNLPLKGTFWQQYGGSLRVSLGLNSGRCTKAESQREIPPTLPNRGPCGHVYSSPSQNKQLQTNLLGHNGTCPPDPSPDSWVLLTLVGGSHTPGKMWAHPPSIQK